MRIPQTSWHQAFCAAFAEKESKKQSGRHGRKSQIIEVCIRIQGEARAKGDLRLFELIFGTYPRDAAGLQAQFSSLHQHRVLQSWRHFPIGTVQ